MGHFTHEGHAGVASEMIGAHLAGWDVVTGLEREAEYIEQGRARLQWWTQFDSYEEAKAAHDVARKQRKQDDALPVQPALFDDPAA